MKVEEADGAAERLVMAALITDDAALARVASRYEKGAFGVRWLDALAQLCADFHARYGAAPGQHIEGLFAAWAAKRSDPDAAALAERFLESLAGEYAGREVNGAYAVDLAGRLFDRNRLRRLRDELDGALASGDVEAGCAAAGSFSRAGLTRTEPVDLFRDPAAVEAAFSRPGEALVRYPGAAGEFFGDSLCRGGFVSFFGKDKVGKSFWLLDLAVRAAAQRRRVLYFECGDLSQDQVVHRFGCRVARRPLRDQPVRWPTGMRLEQREALVDREERAVEPLDAAGAVAGFAHFMQRAVKSNESYLKLSCHPTMTLQVAQAQALAEEQARLGYIPDVICLDYADILASPPGHADDPRGAINENWARMRALSLALDCLVVTATQANADSYRAETLDMRNFSNDKRKNAHVTAMYGINQDPAEKAAGVYRINCTLRRAGAFDPRRVLYTASCLEVADPCVRSLWP